MGAYFYLAKMQLLISLTYRFEVFTTIGTRLVIMVSSIYLWKTAYKGMDIVAGVNESQMVTYSIISTLMWSFYVYSGEGMIRSRIQRGEIAIDLIRPINFFLNCFATSFGRAASSIINVILPIILLMAIFIQVPAASGFLAAILSIVSMLLGYGIIWLIGAVVGMASFWVMEMGNLGVVKDALVQLLSGRIIPLWLFPKNVQRVLSFFPFQYIYQTPISIYIGKISTNQALPSMGLQLLWIIGLIMVLFLMWGKAKKRLLIQGG